MTWEILADSKLVENLGWTLVHSVWQIGLITFVLLLVLRIFNRISANLRYLIAVAALGFALILPFFTLVQLTNNLSQNHLSNDVITAETSNSQRKEQWSRENLALSINNNSTTTTPANENIYFSVASLQKHFKQNLNSALPMFVLLWIFGVCIFAFRLCGGVWQLHKYKTREVSLPDSDWQKRFSALCENLKISQTVKLMQSNRIETPIVAGWLNPLILVPTSVFFQMNPQQLETILAHELIHIRRYDNLVNFAQSSIEILFFCCEFTKAFQTKSQFCITSVCFAMDFWRLYFCFSARRRCLAAP
jgi:beta-lactamase regulating signal transducer with metallopeptidase domain